MITAKDLDDMDDLFSVRPERKNRTPVHKLVRTKDPVTSHEAAKTVDTNRMEQVVLEAIQSFKEEGCISDRVLSKLSHHRYSTVTARYKQLKEKGLIKVDHRTDVGLSGRKQLIMWATEFYVEQEDG